MLLNKPVTVNRYCVVRYRPCLDAVLLEPVAHRFYGYTNDTCNFLQRLSLVYISLSQVFLSHNWSIMDGNAIPSQVLIYPRRRYPRFTSDICWGAVILNIRLVKSLFCKKGVLHPLTDRNAVLLQVIMDTLRCYLCLLSDIGLSSFFFYIGLPERFSGKKLFLWHTVFS